MYIHRARPKGEYVTTYDPNDGGEPVTPTATTLTPLTRGGEDWTGSVGSLRPVGFWLYPLLPPNGREGPNDPQTGTDPGPGPESHHWRSSPFREKDGKGGLVGRHKGETSPSLTLPSWVSTRRRYRA